MCIGRQGVSYGRCRFESLATLLAGWRRDPGIWLRSAPQCVLHMLHTSSCEHPHPTGTAWRLAVHPTC
jgi:hypothetical protein